MDHDHHDHCPHDDNTQVAGNTGSPADRDYVNEAVDYFKNKLRSIIIRIIIMIIRQIHKNDQRSSHIS